MIKRLDKNQVLCYNHFILNINVNLLFQCLMYDIISVLTLFSLLDFHVRALHENGSTSLPTGRTKTPPFPPQPVKDC
jgi:hypothetical protein